MSILPHNGFIGELKGKVRNEANLINFDQAYQSIDDGDIKYAGVTVTVNDDGSLTLDGTATGSATVTLLTKQGGFGTNVHLTLGKVDLGKDAKSNVTVESNGTVYASSHANSSVTFTATGDSIYTVKLNIADGDTFEKVTIYPVLNYGTSAASYFAIN